MKLFLDDYRSLDESIKDISTVRSYNSCVQLLQTFGNEIEFIDLDYDLGTKEAGLDVLMYMFERGIRPRQINIHSDSPEGVPLMRKYAKEHFPDSQVTTIRLPQE